MAGWEGGSVLNKPFLAADADGVYATDPEQHRVLRFSPTVAYWPSLGNRAPIRRR